jgi:hypothetical protein
MKVCILLLLLCGIAIGQVPTSSHVWIITEENHSYEEVVGNSNMPYFNSLAAQYGLATEYYSNHHNSLTALMWLVAGQPVTTDDNATSCFDVNNVVRGVLSRGLTWKSYQVDLPFAGFPGLSWLNYVRRHNPLIDFTDSCSSAQAMNSVPYTQLASDMQNNDTANFIYISPNLNEDAHDGTLPEADQWLSQELPAILARPEFAPGGDGVLFVVWDEGDIANDSRCSARLSSGCGGKIATLVIGPQVRPHYQSAVRYDHANMLRTVCDAMGITSCPGEAAVASPMADFFNKVNVIAPLSNTRVASPVHIQADTNNSSAVNAVQIYVDDVLNYQVSGSTIDTMRPMSVGKHHVVLQSWDASGGIHKSGAYVTVQPQAVIVNSPLQNATVTSPVPVVATGGGKNPVQTMQIYVDNALAYQVNAGAVNTTVPMSNGSHHVVVQAWDTSGGITKTGVNISVSAPTVTIAKPAVNAQMYSPLQIVANTQDANPVYAVQVYVDDTLQYEFSGTGLEFPLAIPAGTHSLVVQAWDTAGGIYKQRETITVKPVNVKISSPLNNASTSSPVKINASVPTNSPVYTMQVYVDNALQYQTNGTVVNTALPMGSGPHLVVVQAWDNGGGTWKSSAQITVQ